MKNKLKDIEIDYSGEYFPLPYLSSEGLSDDTWIFSEETEDNQNGNL